MSSKTSGGGFKESRDTHVLQDSRRRFLDTLVDLIFKSSYYYGRKEYNQQALDWYETFSILSDKCFGDFRDNKLLRHFNNSHINT